MNSFFLLMTAALVSIHQYIPVDNPDYQKYYSDVRDLKEEEVFPAANQSCRYLYGVFVSAGVEATLGGNSNPLSKVLTGIIGSQSGFQSVLGMLDSPNVIEKMEGKNINSKEMKEFLSQLCSDQFNPLRYTPNQRKQVMEFVEKEIGVLSKRQLMGLGDYNLYGSTQVFDSKQRLIGQLGPGDRHWTPVEKVSSYVILALLAAEDTDFFQHAGVDTLSIARMVKEVASSNRVTGGSTLTMQLLKNLHFLEGPAPKDENLRDGNSLMVLRKVREWYWAKPLEKESRIPGSPLAGKYDILEKYLNVVYLGSNIQGVGQASQVYFGKSVSDLTLAEAAYLVTLLKAPTTYSKPANYVERTLPRRNDYVLNRMMKLCEQSKKKESSNQELPRLCRNQQTGKPLNSEEFNAAKDQALPTWRRPESEVFEDSMGTTRIYVADWLEQLKQTSEGSYKEIQVQTTVDQVLQEKVFRAVKKKIDQYDQGFQKLNYIRPARDDRGRIAQVEVDDLGYRYLYRLRSLTSSQSSDESKYLFSVSLGRGANGRTHLSLSQKLIEETLQELGELNSTSRKRARSLVKEIRQKPNRLGQVYFVELSLDGHSILTTEEAVGRFELEDGVKARVVDLTERPYVERLLQKNALARLDRYKQRDFLTPVFVSDLGLILNKDLEPIKLEANHNWYFKKYLSIKERMYWARLVQGQSEATPDDLKRYQLDAPRLQAAAIVLDSKNGDVLANFGGYSTSRTFFDRSFASKRQVGSTVKPWVYLTALNKGFLLGDTLPNDWVSFSINNGRSAYRPRNFSGKSPARTSFSRALVNSYNIATFQLIKDPRWGGTGDWHANLQDMRNVFDEIGLYDKTRNNVSVLIGAQESTLAQLASTYTYFSNGLGIVEPQFIKKAVDYRGEEIYQSEVKHRFRVNSNPHALFSIQLLLADIANSGTAGSLRSFVENLQEGALKDRCFLGLPSTGKQSCIGGKTGTTNNGRDAWFVGFSKNFVIGVWVGYDENIPIPDNPTGGKLALPIFKEIITQAYDDLPMIEPFISPNEIPLGMDYQAGEAFYAQNEWQPSEVTSRPEVETQKVTPAKGSCWCSASGSNQFWINASYGGKSFSRVGGKSYKSKKACQKKLRSVKVGSNYICR